MRKAREENNSSCTDNCFLRYDDDEDDVSYTPSTLLDTLYILFTSYHNLINQVYHYFLKEKKMKCKLPSMSEMGQSDIFYDFIPRVSQFIVRYYLNRYKTANTNLSMTH